MKNYSLRNTLSIAGQFLLIGLLSLSVACKDEPARLTGDVLPDGEKISGDNYDEHILLTTNTSRTSVRTSDASYGIIGIFDDPDFGRSEAAFISDFSLGKKVSFSVDILDDSNPNDTIIHKSYVFNRFDNNNDTIADVWRVDSLVLNLQYQFNNWYGDMLHKQNVNIYELSGPLGANNQEFYSDHDVSGMYEPTPIAIKEVHPNNEVPDSLKSTNWLKLFEHPDSLWNHPQYLWDNDKVKADKDSTWLDEDFNGNTTTTKYWNFKLDKEVADRFFEMTESELQSSSVFKNSIFSGIYVALDEISASNGDGWLTKVNLLSSSSSIATNITIHLGRDHKYLNSHDVIRDTTSNYEYTFPINLENVRFNTYNHEINESVIDTDDENPERIYIQGMAGSYMQLQLPDEILNWTDSIKDPQTEETLNYQMVSNIELFMEIDTIASNPDRYPTPSKLTIKWLEDGKLVDPTYTIDVNGNEIISPLFGSDADGSGSRSGIGERVVRFTDDGVPEYYYRFLMRADVFNHLMREEDGGGLNEKQFFIGPESTTSNFQRVILFSGSEANDGIEYGGKQDQYKRMKLNIKYYKYRPR